MKMPKKYFWIGLGVRIFAALAVIVFTFNDEILRYNDQGHYVYQALIHLLNGQNPYLQQYELFWEAMPYVINFGYAPGMIVFFLPAMLFPQWVGTFWLGGWIMINFYTFLLCELIMCRISTDRTFKDAEHTIEINGKVANKLVYWSGIFFWVFPIWFSSVTVLIYLPILLLYCAFAYRDKPFLSGSFIFLAVMTYQLCLLFLPVFAAYFLKKDAKISRLKLSSIKSIQNFVFGLNWKKFWLFVLGTIPALLLAFPFLIWGGEPMVFVENTFLTSASGYVHIEGQLREIIVVSIPKILYNASGGEIMIGPQARLIMIGILSVILAYYVLTDKIENHGLFLNQYFLLAAILYTLTTNRGQPQYVLFTFIPIAFVFYSYFERKFWGDKHADQPQD